MTALLPKPLVSRSLLVILSFAFSILAFAADVTGTYHCEGDAGGGKKYVGKVTITQKGDVYSVVWKLAGNETYNGIGILQGDVLAVSYYGSMTGVVAYKVESSDKLVGKWTVKGAAEVRDEILTK
jgi:hypothetical protein